MAHSQATPSHPICPTCQGNLSDQKEVRFLANVSGDQAPAVDDYGEFYEETARLIRFLGALAEAGPHAAAAHGAELGGTPSWVQYFSWLGEELTEEVTRRLALLKGAAVIWEKRAKTGTPGGRNGQ